MIKKCFTILFLAILINMVSAGITISQPAKVYNFGDRIPITLTVNPPQVEGDFELKLVCGEDSETAYKISPAESAFTAGQEIKINHKMILEKQYIGNLSGECHILTSLGSITASTETFRLTSAISIKARLDKEYYDPGETVVLNIEATKANGQKLTGFIKGTGIFDFEKAITDGELREAFVTKGTLESGNYSLELNGYDSDKNGNTLNSENTTVQFKINQVASSVPISLSSLQLIPGDTLSFQADLFDQSGEKMDGQINIEFISPLNEKISRTIASGGKGEIKTETNSTAGTWTLYSAYGKLKEERQIQVREQPLLKFEFLENSSVLMIRNVGNSRFADSVSVDIGNETRNITLNINPGEERKFTLSAPTGEHNIKVTGGNSSLEKRLLLTGRAISIEDYGKYLIISQYPAVWSILATIIILLGIVLFFRYNKITFRLDKKIKSQLTNWKEHHQKSQEETFHSNSEKPGINSAEASLVIKGTREPSTIVAIKLKNELKSSVRNDLERILKNLTKEEMAIDSTETEIFVIFSPRKTKTYKNEYNAIKFAFELNKLLQEYNRKFRDKIEFGIGISSGDLISSIEGTKLRYTGIDNTIILAKKISGISDQEVIISDRVKNKLLREVRTEKKEIGGNTYYKVLRLAEREENQEKLQDLLKRTNFQREPSDEKSEQETDRTE